MASNRWLPKQLATPTSSSRVLRTAGTTHMRAPSEFVGAELCSFEQRQLAEGGHTVILRCGACMGVEGQGECVAEAQVCTVWRAMASVWGRRAASNRGCSDIPQQPLQEITAWFSRLPAVDCSWLPTEPCR